MAIVFESWRMLEIMCNIFFLWCARQLSCQLHLLLRYYLYFILGFAFEIPGRPVTLQCGDAIEDGREELKWWKTGDHEKQLLLARGIYVDGVLTYASYPNKPEGGRSELSQNGSLILLNHEYRYNRLYQCTSEYRLAWVDIERFSMYIFFTLDIFIQIYDSFDTLKSMLIAIRGCRGTTNKWFVAYYL